MLSSQPKTGTPVLLEFKCPHARKPVHVESLRGSQKWSKELKTAWENAGQDFKIRMQASGRPVKVETRPLGREFFVATFSPLTEAQQVGFEIFDTWNLTKVE
jgi:hypothetical protein